MIIRCYAQKQKCIERGEKAARTRYRGVNAQILCKLKSIMKINSTNKLNP